MHIHTHLLRKVICSGTESCSECCSLTARVKEESRWSNAAVPSEWRKREMEGGGFGGVWPDGTRGRQWKVRRTEREGEQGHEVVQQFRGHTAAGVEGTPEIQYNRDFSTHHCPLVHITESEKTGHSSAGNAGISGRRNIGEVPFTPSQHTEDTAPLLGIMQCTQ